MLSSRLVFALFWVSTVTAGSAEPAIAAEPDAVRQKELVRLVRQLGLDETTAVAHLATQGEVEAKLTPLLVVIRMAPF